MFSAISPPLKLTNSFLWEYSGSQNCFIFKQKNADTRHRCV